MTEEYKTQGEIRLHLAKNIRILMSEQEVSKLQLTHVLKIDNPNVVGQKINGKVDFEEQELKILAAFFNTTVEALYGNIQDNLPPKYDDGAKSKYARKQAEAVEFTIKEQPPAPESVAKVGKLIQAASPLVKLIRQTESNELHVLLEKTYMAKLTGKIDDLSYYIRNNILLKVLRQVDFEVSATDREDYVEHFVYQYDKWKDNLVQDDDDVLQAALADNKLETIASVLPISAIGGLSKYLISLAKKHLDQQNGEVDIEAFVSDIGATVEYLQKAKTIFTDYLNNKD